MLAAKLIPVMLVGLAAAMTLYAQGGGSDNQIRFYQWRIQRDLDDYTNYDHLGSAYLQKARETGDPIYYNFSEKAYLQAQSLLPSTDVDSASIIAHLGALYLSEHRFQEAFTSGEKALSLNPDLLSVNATIGDAQIETGRYDEAAVSYTKLKAPLDSIQPRPGLQYLAETRQASLNYLRGRPTEAIEHMRAAIAMAQKAGLPKENIAWSQFSLGELYFGIGDAPHAEEEYQAALATYPNYHRALAWLAQLRASQGKYSAAVALYRKAIAIIPLPVYAAALGDLYAKLGESGNAKKQYQVVELIARLGALNQQLFRRELALFWADHDMRLPEALQFALSELSVRKDVFTWDVLSWVQFKNGMTAEAVESIEHALAIGTKDAQLFFHAGMIYERQGDSRKAMQFLQRALTLNPNFHISYAESARQTLDRLKRQSPDL